MKLTEIPVGKLVSKCETWNPRQSHGSFSYIDLSSVDKDTKSIAAVEEHECSAAPSRARQLVRAGDILVATVRPNLNGVATVNIEHDGMTASTGYCVLRPIPEKIEHKYLFHWVKTPQFVQRMVDVASGANYPAVSDAKVKASKIPLPPLEEQKRIAGILDAADRLRAKRRETLAQLDALLQSTFLELFGDPVTNPKGWEVQKLKELTDSIMNGTTPKGGKEVYVEQGVTFFRSQNVWRNRLSFEDIAYLDEDTHKKMKKSSLKNKDILMTKTGRFNTENSSLGRAAIFLGEDDTANINGHVYLIRLKEGMVHEFVLFILTTNEYREYIRRVCVGGIDKRQINKEHLNEFPIILPPLDLQRRFAAIVESVEKQKAQQRAHLAELDALFASLQSRAFNGEL